MLEDTLTRLDEDLPPTGLKIGMLGSAETVEVVATFLRGQREPDKKHGHPLVVLDPVLRSSSGLPLLTQQGVSALERELLPLVDWITPNWAEVGLLSGLPVSDLETAERAGRELMDRYRGLKVVVTGGDQAQPVDLVLLPEKATVRLTGEHLESTSTHGTGCAFSSALLAHLVLGAEPAEAAREAKAFVTGAIRRAPGLGGGRGPLDLLWPLRRP